MRKISSPDGQALTNRLFIFLKAPRPGRVKRRLAASLGAVEACRAYSDIVSHLVATLAPLREVVLHYTPASAQTLIAPWIKPGWTSCAQSPGGLGVRLSH